MLLKVMQDTDTEKDNDRQRHNVLCELLLFYQLM